MATRALAIRNAILTTLRASAVAGIPADRIYSDLRDAIHTRPSIVVDMGDEDPPTKVYSTRTRTVALTLRILAEGADPFTAIDPVRIAAHARVMADKTMGGLCDGIDEGASSRDRADMEVSIASLVTTYVARYSTDLEALT